MALISTVKESWERPDPSLYYIGESSMMAIILWCYFLQRWWQFRGHSSHKGHPKGLRKSGMEAARHLSLFVWDGRRVFPLRRTDVCHEIWLVDLRWFPGNVGIGYPIFGYTQGYPYPYPFLGVGWVWLSGLLSFYESDTWNYTFGYFWELSTTMNWGVSWNLAWACNMGIGYPTFWVNPKGIHTHPLIGGMGCVGSMLVH